MLSVFEMFKVGIGPSSSHTVGPMKAGKAFVDMLIAKKLLAKITRIEVDIHGALALTGKGHGTDQAIILGLTGAEPDRVDLAKIPQLIAEVTQQGRLPLANGQYEIDFPVDAMRFLSENLPRHENGLIIRAYQQQQLCYENTYYSVGGGFIVDAAHFDEPPTSPHVVPYPFHSAAELLELCQQHQLSFIELITQNELAHHSAQEISAYFANIWQVMQHCIDLGIHTDGVLPGPLRVPRRAAPLYRMLTAQPENIHDPMRAMDWVNLFALAIGEQNAAGQRVVTAPTNGACGIVPAVLAYYDKFITPVTPEQYEHYFLVCGGIGLLYKMNASISGAEVGCQGEVGVACSMAAAGLASLLGGDPNQICMAAEIGMEHNLGLTCDPVAGQVQVPCIERNAIAGVKAINAARMALLRGNDARVSLDKVIETMYETGKDMNAKYRETSRGGLAIKVQCD